MSSSAFIVSCVTSGKASKTPFSALNAQPCNASSKNALLAGVVRAKFGATVRESAANAVRSSSSPLCKVTASACRKSSPVGVSPVPRPIKSDIVVLSVSPSRLRSATEIGDHLSLNSSQNPSASGRLLRVNASAMLRAASSRSAVVSARRWGCGSNSVHDCQASSKPSAKMLRLRARTTVPWRQKATVGATSLIAPAFGCAVIAHSVPSSDSSWIVESNRARTRALIWRARC